MENNVHELVAAAKYFGAGLAALGVIGAALGVGRIFSSLIDGIARNPSAKNDMSGFAYIGAGLTEALGLLALLVSFILLYAK